MVFITGQVFSRIVPEDKEGFRSSIYKWFQVDFGGSKEGVIAHLLQYADKPLAESLKGFKGRITYHYDWALNE